MSPMAKTKDTEISTRFYSILETLFRELDQKEIRREVEVLKKTNPKSSPEALARMLIRRSAIRTATVGAAAGVAGGPWALLAMAPDIFNLVRVQSRLVLSIAFLYGRAPSLKERFREVLAVLAASTGTTFARQGVRRLVARGFETRAARDIVRKIGGRYLARKAPAVIPAVGSIAGGAMNYLSVRAVGQAAIEYYSNEQENAPPRRKAPARKKARKRKVAASGTKRARRSRAGARTTVRK